MSDSAWIQTYSGKAFYPLNPDPSKIDIVDIAHSLSMQCRYNGHCVRFYSVAEHCVTLSFAVAPEHSLWALLHDASEAYLSDVPRPIKHLLTGYAEAEKRLENAIFEHFGLRGPVPAQVKEYDFRILNNERADLMQTCERDWEPMGEPLGDSTIHRWGWDWRTARQAFLFRFHQLNTA